MTIFPYPLYRYDIEHDFNDKIMQTTAYLLLSLDLLRYFISHAVNGEYEKMLPALKVSTVFDIDQNIKQWQIVEKQHRYVKSI